MTFEFETVPDKLREATPASRLGTRTANPIVARLVAGETIFVPNGTDRELNGFYEVARKGGFKLNKFKTTLDDGRTGYIMYYTKKEDEK